jgi:hypothetical protein
LRGQPPAFELLDVHQSHDRRRSSNRRRARSRSGRLDGCAFPGHPRAALPADPPGLHRSASLRLGLYRQTVPVPGVVSLVKELTYIHSIAYSRHDGIRDTEQAAALLAGNPTIAQTVITHRFPLDEAAEAFRVAGDRASGAIKVVLHP